MKHRRFSGFTLIELLVTLTIVATLGAASTVGISAARQKAKCVVEINAARNLVAAYVSHATDHNGKVMAGYQKDDSVTNLQGEPLHDPMNARYPWRIAQTLPKVEGILLYNGNESALKSENSDYLVSVHPNLGLNATLLGGHFGTGSPLSPSPKMVTAFGKFYLSHLSESTAPESLLVFASARSGENAPGYFEVRPPALNRPVWSSEKFSAETPPSAHGFVDLRWGGKAVCAMLGGNVELLDEESLRDMRRWSIQAAAENEPSFIIRPQ